VTYRKRAKWPGSPSAVEPGLTYEQCEVIDFGSETAYLISRFWFILWLLSHAYFVKAMKRQRCIVHVLTFAGFLYLRIEHL